MLTLNMLGHVYVTRDGQSVQVSNKGAALLSYLALEKQSHHREHLADLLWENPQSLRNLRVELTRLKQQGISPFPARQPMLSLNCPTDLDTWLRSAQEVSEATLPDWLSRMRGFPLSGLEDVGSSTFRSWVEQQRWSISEALEQTLGQVYQRFLGRGRQHALELIRETAERLGLTLPAPATTLQPADSAVFRYWAQEQQLRQVAEQALAEQSAHVVYLCGPAGSHRSTIAGTFLDTAWKVMHIQLSERRRFVQAALIQNLAQMLPEFKAEFLDLLRDTTEGGELDLIRMSALLARAAQPVVIAVQFDQSQPWFINAMRFLLDLPYPVIVIACTTSSVVVRQTQEQLGTVRWTQVHELTLPGVGTASILEARRGQGQACTFEEAAQWAQCSDGWPLYLQTMWTEGAALTSPCPPQPQTITSALLAELGGLSACLRSQMSRLAQLHDRFDPALAAYVLGEEALPVLEAGRQQGLLVAAAAQETVTLPELHTWVDDTETHLTFSSEVLRIALARQLPPPERHRIRTMLAEYYQHRCAALHAYYARRCGQLLGEGEVAAQAPTAPNKLAPFTPLPDYLPPPTVSPRQELRTPNSYRIALENGQLEVMRKGWLGPAPLLRLSFGTLPAGRWQCKLRLDVFRNYTRDPAPIALAVRHGEALQASYAPEPLLPPHTENEFCVYGQLPQHQWLLIQGQSGGGELCLELRGMDVALTIAELTWNGHNLLNPRAHQA